MLRSTLLACWQPSQDFISLAVEGLAITMLGWVARRTRGISKDVQLTSQEVEATLVVAHQLLGRSALPPAAPVPKK